tara:strand:+ start:1628 stop:2572 length:945 start_codon:yes stop_codon:yes gene_type:complete
MAETQVTQNLPPEYIQQGYTNLIQNASDYVGSAGPLPNFQLAGFSPAQQQAMQQAYSMQGYSYDPSTGFTQTGQAAGQPEMELGLGALGQYGNQAGSLYNQAASAQFDPSSYKNYLNPFQDEITKAINEQGAMAQNQAAAQQAMGGTYGGSRGQIQQGQIQGNIFDTIGQATSQNYNTAMGQAMQNFQNEQQRGFAGAQGLGALGQSMNQGYQNQAMMQNQLQGQGVNQMMGIGQMQQQLGQASLDADRANQMQLINRPMQMYGFMSDILSGAPATMGYQYTQNYGQAGSPFSQMLGTGASILGGLGQFGKMMK